MVILLDIDGVLETTPPWRRVEIHTDGFMKLDENALYNLSILIQKTNASIILTTSHRINYDESKWEEIFRTRGVDCTAISKLNDKTEISQLLERGTEIKEWAETEGMNQNYVILDDDSSLYDLPDEIKARWVQIRPLVGFDKEALKKALLILTITSNYACPCCGHTTFTEEPNGTYGICPVCYWEDDPIQLNEPNYDGGANRVSLRQAQKNFIEFGATTIDIIRYVRPPNTFERQEIKSREYDSQFVDGATVMDLDRNLLQGIADQYIKGLSIERYLQQIGLADYAQNGLRLKRAALLLFAMDIDRWHPRCQVRFLKVNGNTVESGEKYNVVSDEVVKGNIFELVIKSWEHARSYLAYKTEFGSNSQFEQKYIYPEDAVREAILNAIAHRDYSIANAIEVFFFDDRMEIKSPGALISTLTIKNLYMLEGSHESRNSLIARVLRESKLMRELGEGMKRIFTLMQEQDRIKPELYSNGLWFRVTLSRKTNVH